MDLEEYLPPKDLWPDIKIPEEVKIPANCNLTWFLLDRHIEEGLGELKAVIFYDKVYRYNDLYELSLKLANFFKKLGLKKGDRISFVILNSPQALAVNFAIFRIGAISVPISPFWPPQITEALLNQVKPKVIIVSSKYARLISTFRKLPFIKHIIMIKRGLDVPEEIADSIYEDIIEKEETNYILEKVEPDFPYIILHTSGTTSIPKGCVHLAKSIIAECYLVNKYVWRLTRGDIITGAAPIVFAAGFGTFVLIPPFAGATSILFVKFEPERLLEAIEKYQATVLTGLTSFYEALLNSPNLKHNTLDSVRLCTTGGSILEPRVYKMWYDRTGHPIFEGLGATEFLHLITSNAVRLKPKPGSIGIPIPGFEIEIIDEKGEKCSPNKMGKMLIKGPTGPIYWNNIKKQKDSVIDGWAYIGDIVTRDEEGYLHFMAREEDVLEKDGIKFSPHEIEEIMREHKYIKDVGVIEDKKNSQIIACVCIKEEAKDIPRQLIVEELKRFVLDKTKNRYKVPDEIHFVDIIPRTPAGKVLRWILREKEDIK